MLAHVAYSVTPLSVVPAPKFSAPVRKCLICNDTGKVVISGALQGVDCGCGDGRQSLYAHFTWCVTCNDSGMMDIWDPEIGTDQIPCEHCADRYPGGAAAYFGEAV